MLEGGRVRNNVNIVLMSEILKKRKKLKFLNKKEKSKKNFSIFIILKDFFFFS